MRAVFLDMGAKMYGDCIFLDLDGFTILIDGGHPQDFAAGANVPSQLKQLTGKPRVEVDLLVVTHTHDDHVGCLPHMVEAGALTARYALVSDPDHRWTNGDTDGADLGETARALLDVLGEELPDPARDRDGFNQLLDAARDLKTRYRDMIASLKTKGTKVVRYQTDALKPISDLLRPRGVRVLGPTKKHLALCKAALVDARDEVRDQIRDAMAQDASVSLADLYTRIFGTGGRDAANGLDAASRSKGAINNLSIVMAVDLAGKKLLLPGDMQFAKPETDGLEPLMTALVKKVAAAGPYAAVKLPHHTSYNGWSEQLHRETLNAPLLLHSGGREDANHPEEAVLAMLKRWRAGHTFLRTDRNGRITLTPTADRLAHEKAGGALNDFSPNPGSDMGETTPLPAVVSTSVSTVTPRAGDVVRVTADIPPGAGKVVITVEVAPRGYQASVASATPGSGGVKKKPLTTPELTRDFVARCAGLLFVSNESRLAQKLGDDSVTALRTAVSGADAGWIGDLPYPFSAEGIHQRIASALSERTYRGVVILGDYDVAPPARYDCLPADVRAQISPEVDDPDNFVVWSDGPYGDSDADGVQDVPVSRVPDAGSPELFWSILTHGYQRLDKGYMLRNVNRPFADTVHALLPKASPHFESRPTRATAVKPEQLSEADVYLMLHGSDYDAARFWGEEEDAHVEAINSAVLPDSLTGVVFAGCCWGALIGREPAYRVVSDDPPLSRRIADSMALSCLARGATAFVGCTGAHYSPIRKPYNYFGHPMHTAFWQAIAEGQPPSAALFAARQNYLANVPHPTPGDRPAIDELAIELKLYQQFTCLGFGW
jgi:beta-lactamase superfamily II metal-dependent hydrolase